MSGIDQIVNDNANSRTLAPKAVLSQFVLMTVISLVTVVTFSLLRPNNKIIYEPKLKYHEGNKQPPRIPNSTFGWVSPLIHVKEPELVDKLGLDAVTFLRFLRMFRWLFTAVAVLCCAVLIPTDIIYNLRHVKSSNRDILSMMTIRGVSHDYLLVHIAASYVITGVVMFFVYVHWKAMVRLRQAWYRSPEYQETFYARTLVVQHVPKKYQSDEGIRAIFESFQVPYPTTSVHVGRRVGLLPSLIEHHNDNVRELERYLVRYLKNGRIGKKRPTATIGGFLGFGGQKVDAIDYYAEKIRESEAKVEAYRAQIDNNKPENYGFASMAAVPYAHIVARMLKNKKPKGTTIQLAPNPKDIIWENLTLSNGAIARKKTMGFVWLGVVCFINTIPLFVISILANLTAISNSVAFLGQWKSASPNTFAIVSGILPPAVSALFGYLLPVIMRWLSQYQGALTTSRLDRAVVARYFAFLVISQLVIFTLIGVGFRAAESIIQAIGKKSFKDIIDNLHELPENINNTYIDQSSYWLTFFPLRGFLAVFDLAQIINLLWITFKKRVFGRTPREVRDWCKPPDFQYAIYYSNTVFMGCVALVFAPLAPLVVVAAAIVFWISSWVYKYQLMFVFTTKVETGGRLWNVVINRVLFSVMLMQALVILTTGLGYGWKTFQWISAVPPILIVMAFKVYLSRTFSNAFRYYNPTEEEIKNARIHSARADAKGNRLANRFGHPVMHSELFTPMVHANMVPLLAQVFNGKIGTQQTKMDEMGGQRMQAAVVGGGVKIAGIQETDLEYDPTLYQRDRGEQDWDARSFATTNILAGNDGASLAPSKSMFYANGRSASPAPGFDHYLANGPQRGDGSQEAFEMAQLEYDSGADQQPLLSPGHMYAQASSASSLPSYAPAGLQYPSQSSLSMNPPQAGYREAPLHRPYTPSRQASGYSSGGEPNMAGRGAFHS
ncbi:DUF221-domain-containing protein [Punctularia strigosozonata HHB-11173 SS5]|uniref:DUF221-domain-containing protein n=1 Tax=Punctularia strigosozonata (strain HHB-11173) TaxID=741275 RepID=UPI0004416B35|nr:DUF221-domain-containing protein [Punctularia strigosozonata HHB-11173 SS5]EIN06583.1 DUF221-domain-containing protein [Punctularia strigosozonata HHB-11173 SS5]